MLISISDFLSWILLACIFIAFLSVIFQPYLVEKIFNLILVFIFTSFWLLLTGFEFFPLVLLIIYVGAIAVLFLFVVIIVNPDFSDIQEKFKQLFANWSTNLAGDTPIQQSISKFLVSYCIHSLVGFLIITIYLGLSLGGKLCIVTFAVLESVDFKINLLVVFHDLVYLADVLYLDHGLCLLLIGVILLIAIVGSISLVINSGKGIKRQNISDQFSRYRW